MKIHSLKAAAVGCHHEEISLPIDDLGDAQVIAITGDNGEGKTNLIEYIPGLVYGEMPSRGAVAAFATAKNSYIEGVLETDRIYRLRRTINGLLKRPKTEAYLWAEDGKPVGSSDGKQSTFDAEVAKIFPSQRVYLSSGFSSQTRVGQFLEIPKSERKALFADMLGLEFMQELSEDAGKRAKTVEEDIQSTHGKEMVLVGQAEHYTELVPRIKEARQKIDEISRERDDFENKMATAKAEMETWRTRASELDKGITEADGSLRLGRQRHGHAKQELERIEQQISQLESEIEGLRKQLARKPELEKQATDIDEKRLAEVDQEIHDLHESVSNYHKEHDSWRTRKQKLEANLQRCREAWNTAVSKAKSHLQLVENDLRGLERTAAGLQQVPCNGDETCPLLANAVTASAALPAQRKDVEEARSALETAKADTSDGEEAKKALENLEEEPRPPEIKNGLKALEEEAKKLREKQSAAIDAKARLEALGDAEERLSKLNADAEQLQEQHAAGKDVLEDIARDVATSEGKLLALRDQRADHEASKPETPDEQDIQTLRRSEQSWLGQKVALEERLAVAEKAKKEVQELRKKIQEATAEADDWRHLQKAFGRNGIQALEVDAAGPEVSSLINDLLESCFGSRFVCKLETTALTADGKRSKEIFDLTVIDTQKGWEGSASNLSGGEKVIVAEALGLAIAIYNARRSSIPILDIFRDECSGALDYKKAPMYVTMLRKAVQIGGFHRVFFVAHQRELWDLADAVVEVADGKATVRMAA